MKMREMCKIMLEHAQKDVFNLLPFFNLAKNKKPVLEWDELPIRM